jgi:hypothetical protein
MTEWHLFFRFCAIGGGALVLLLCLFIGILPFVLLVGWAKRPVQTDSAPPQLSNPYSPENVVKT